MPRLIQRLSSISPSLPRSGPPPGRRLLALVLSAMLVFGSTLPGFAVAGEADSEGEGTTPPIEVPVAPPDFDPGGEETGLEEGPDSGVEEEGAEGAAVEPEAETPIPVEVTSAAPEVTVEAPPPSPMPAPEPATAPAPEPELQKAAEPSEPVVNQSITAPKEARGVDSTASTSANTAEAPSTEEESPAPTSPPVATPPPDPGRTLGGKEYVVRPGDCLWHIAAAVLPAGSDIQAIKHKVRELWRMNQDRIGTDDPNLIYPGTVLLLG